MGREPLYRGSKCTHGHFSFESCPWCHPTAELRRSRRLPWVAAHWVTWVIFSLVFVAAPFAAAGVRLVAHEDTPGLLGMFGVSCFYFLMFGWWARGLYDAYYTPSK